MKIVVAFLLIHSWYNPDCCNDSDCEPLAAAPTIEGDMYVLPNGGRFLIALANPSQDGRWHWCHYRGSVFCLYAPMAS